MTGPTHTPQGLAASAALSTLPSGSGGGALARSRLPAAVLVGAWGMVALVHLATSPVARTWTWPLGYLLLEGLATLPARVDAQLRAQEFHLALDAIMAEARAANGYITVMQPWALKKTDVVRMGEVLRHLHTALRAYATVLQPFMPATMAALLDQLGVPGEARGLDALAAPLPEGTALPAPSPLFRKIETPA